MDVYEIVDAYTSDTDPVTTVNALTNKKAPYAYYINYNSHGYAKFKIDPKSLQAFESKLSVTPLFVPNSHS